MEVRDRIFVSLSLVYGLLGGLLGLVRLYDPALVPGNVPRAHGHMMLLGFILMMIYGIALHVIPRFSGFALYSERMAHWQLVAANLGLPLMVAGWLAWRETWVSAGAAASFAAMLLFGLNVILTVRARRPRQP